MTEPVGYMYRKSDREDWLFTLEGNVPYGNYKYVKPVYTSENLHPRVKMTRKQWDEFNAIRNESFSFSDLWTTIFKQGKAYHSITDLTERTLMIAWLDDENVEIVPDMKWFVRSKEKEFGHYQVLAESRESNMPRYTIFESYAMTFDTKEEAELWTNPLTEVVQLPVEENLK